jgi:S1-C subfamily serine protease
MGQAGEGGLTVVLPDGHALPAQIMARDEARDLAVLRVDLQSLAGHDLPALLPPVTLGDSRTLQPGDVVLALGFPWGVTGGATSGVVIGVSDALPEGLGQEPNQDTRREWIAASLHLRPGHSGGPMADARGRLVGINTLMNGPDVGVAIPVHVAEQFVAGQFVAGQFVAENRPSSGGLRTTEVHYCRRV